MPFPFHHQLDAMDCGAASLRMVAEYHGRRYSLQELRQRTFLDREGVSARGIVMAAEGIGLRALPVKIPFQDADNQEDIQWRNRLHARRVAYNWPCLGP